MSFITSPSYFPNQRGNGSVVGVTAGAQSTGQRNFLAGQGAGAFSTVDGLIVIGANAASTGPITDANAKYTTIIGADSAVAYSNASGIFTPPGPLIVLGGGNFPLSTGTILSESIVIGTGIAPTATVTVTPSEAGSNILIGHNILKNLGANVGLFAHNTVIGNDAFQGSNATGLAYNTIVGDSAGQALNNSGGGSANYHTLIGYQSGIALGGSQAQSCTLIGANTGVNLINARNCILIGAGAGHNISGALQGVFAIEAVDGVQFDGVLYGDMVNGDILVGNSTTSLSAREFGTGPIGTNNLKILAGTKGGSNPVGGGFLYVTGANNDLHYVNSAGTDTALTPGGGGGGSFSALTSGTNTTAAMVVGTGASIAISGTGNIAATTVNGLALTAGAILSVNTSMTLSGAAGGPIYVYPPMSGTSTIGYLGLPVNVQSGTYTLALLDQGCLIDCTNIGAQTINIPTHASVAFPFNPATAITIDNFGTTNVSIVPAGGVTLYWSPTGATGTRTLAPFGIVTLVQRVSDVWVISGPGLT